MQSSENMMFTTAHQYLQNGNFQEAILTLQRLDDYYRGFDSSIQNNMVYERVESKHKYNGQYSGWVNYALLGINLLFALSKMRIRNNFHEGKQPNIVAANFLNFLAQKSESPELVYKLLSESYLKPESQVLFKQTAQVHPKTTRARVFGGQWKDYDRIQDGLELLHEIKDLNNLDFNPLAITTQFIIKDKSENEHKILICEIPTTDLTNELQNEYLDYLTKDWYLNANTAVQPYLEMAIQRINQITIHNSQNPNQKQYYPTIPTELRRYLPGLRNAYLERLIVTNLAENETRVIFEGYHFGNPGHSTLGDNNKLTQLSHQQFSKITGTHKTFINTLASPNNFASPWEADLTVQNLKASEETNSIHYSNTAIGGFRGFTDSLAEVSSLILHGIEEQFKVLSNVKTEVTELNQDFILTIKKQEKRLKSIIHELETKPAQQSTTAELKRNQEELLSISKKIALHEYWFNRINQLDKLIQEYRTGSTSSEMVFNENRNLKLAMYIKQIMFAYNELHKTISPDDPKSMVALGDGCVSGKERETILRLYTYTDTIRDYFSNFDLANSYDSSEDFKNIMLALVRSTHFQKFASFLGCSIGAYGLKEDSKGAFLSSHAALVKDDLFYKTAQYNTKIPSTAKKAALNYFYAPLATYSNATEVQKLRTGFNEHVVSPIFVEPVGILDTNVQVPEVFSAPSASPNQSESFNLKFQ